jgi:hypothetical protein
MMYASRSRVFPRSLLRVSGSPLKSHWDGIELRSSCTSARVEFRIRLDMASSGWNQTSYPHGSNRNHKGCALLKSLRKIRQVRRPSSTNSILELESGGIVPRFFLNATLSDEFRLKHSRLGAVRTITAFDATGYGRYVELRIGTLGSLIRGDRYGNLVRFGALDVAGAHCCHKVIVDLPVGNRAV